MKTETQEWIDDTSEQLDIDETNKEPAVTWLRLKIRQASAHNPFMRCIHFF